MSWPPLAPASASRRPGARTRGRRRVALHEEGGSPLGAHKDFGERGHVRTLMVVPKNAVRGARLLQLLRLAARHKTVLLIRLQPKTESRRN